MSPKTSAKKEQITLAIVVPCYNEEESLPIFYKRFKETLPELSKVAAKHNKSLNCELFFVNDGSVDGTKKVLFALAKKDKSIKALNFSRNFGKEAAILCGFDHALKNPKTSCVTLLDADGQDPIDFLSKMLEIWLDGTKIIYTKRVDRKHENALRSLFSRGFYHLSNALSEVRLEPNVRDFRLMDRAVVEVIASMREYHRFSKAMFGWVGFSKRCLEYKNVERSAGSSSFSFWRLFKYAIDGLVSFSCMPLRVAFWVGFVVSLLSGGYGVYVIIKAVFFGSVVAGWPSLATIISFLGGLQLLVLGVMGEYIARIYEQGKNRPIYILEE